MSVTITKTELNKQFEYTGPAFKIIGTVVFNNENEVTSLSGTINDLDGNYLGAMSINKQDEHVVDITGVKLDIIDVVASGVKTLYKELSEN